jgi:hypothetical protein
MTKKSVIASASLCRTCLRTNSPNRPLELAFFDQNFVRNSKFLCLSLGPHFKSENKNIFFVKISQDLDVKMMKMNVNSVQTTLRLSSFPP